MPRPQDCVFNELAHGAPVHHVRMSSGKYGAYTAAFNLQPHHGAVRFNLRECVKGLDTVLTADRTMWGGKIVCVTVRGLPGSPGAT